MPSVLRIRSIFYRIWIRGSDYKSSDPDPSYRYVFDVEQNNNLLSHFLTKSKHLMTLKIKDKNIILTKLYFRQFYITRKLELEGFFSG